MRTLASFLAVAFIATMLGSVSSQASVFSINSFDNGSYDSTGAPADPTNVIVGRAQGGDPTEIRVFRNWLAFDLGAVSGSAITSATLTMFGNNGEYFTPNFTETYGLFGFSGNITSLRNGTGGVGAYNGYGQTVMSAPFESDPMPQLTISLSSTALSDINTAASGSDHRIVIGGVLLSLLSDCANLDTCNQYLYGFSGGIPAGKLTLESLTATPLPGALVLFGSGAGLLGLLGLRRRRATIVAVALPN
jgi:hypothetical protein